MAKKAVIVISSHVARGSVGNRAMVFALETLGHPVWAIPTITLPWHPGHGPATRITPTKEEFADFLQDIANAPWIDEVGAVLTGYMANVEQVYEVASLIRQLKDNNPDLIYLCDPVIGDVEGLYVQEEIANAIRDELIPLCDIATPNRFELAWLVANPVPKTLEEVIALVGCFKTGKLLVTSTPGKTSDEIGNLYQGGNDMFFAAHKQLENPPNGSGDLTAAIYLGHELSGIGSEESLARTSASVFEVLQQSIRLSSNELALEKSAKSILDAQTKINVVKL